jgi:predicted kinase
MNSEKDFPKSLLVPEPEGQRRIVILQGLPASGKSTAAGKAQAAFPGKVAVINNDSISLSLTGEAFSKENKYMPKALANIRRIMLSEALKMPEIKLVVIDNTNLNPRTIEEYKQFADKSNVEFAIENSFLNVSAGECIKRDSLRTNPVGREAILRMSKYLQDSQASN